MPRKAREKSSTGVYHVMIHGINKQNIFEDDEDRQRFIERLSIAKTKFDFELYAYCLMDNHVHLLIKQNTADLSSIMKKIQSSYVYFFNWKYERSGHLFQDRYRSECVEDNEYFYMVIRYIHQNPVKAGISSIDSYKWSSYNDYITSMGITDTAFFMEMLANCQRRYIEFMTEKTEDICLELKETKKLSDEKAITEIKNIGKIKNATNIQNMSKPERDNMLKKCKEIDGISILQISRITGISRGIVKNA